MDKEDYNADDDCEESLEEMKDDFTCLKCQVGVQHLLPFPLSILEGLCMSMNQPP